MIIISYLHKHVNEYKFRINSRHRHTQRRAEHTRTHTYSEIRNQNKCSSLNITSDPAIHSLFLWAIHCAIELVINSWNTFGFDVAQNAFDWCENDKTDSERESVTHSHTNAIGFRRSRDWESVAIFSRQIDSPFFCFCFCRIQTAALPIATNRTKTFRNWLYLYSLAKDRTFLHHWNDLPNGNSLEFLEQCSPAPSAPSRVCSAKDLMNVFRVSNEKRKKEQNMRTTS